MSALTYTTHSKIEDAPLVYIIILNWNGWLLTIDCLTSIGKLDYPNYRVLVVDNGSTDESVKKLQERGGAFRLVETGKNLGFTGGCNVGINEAISQGADYVLLFNNDAKAAPDMLSQMVSAAQESDAAICGARVMDEAGSAIIFDGERWPWNLFGFSLPTSRKSVGAWSDTDRADGCTMLIRRDVLQERNAEDGYFLVTDYFMYCEETEFCRYGLANGFRCVISHGAIAYHSVAKSSGGGGNPRSYYYLTRNRIFLANHWLTLPWKVVFHLWYVPTRLLLQLRRNSVARRAVWEAILDGYGGIRGIWKRHGS